MRSVQVPEHRGLIVARCYELASFRTRPEGDVEDVARVPAYFGDRIAILDVPDVNTVLAGRRDVASFVVDRD